MARLGTEVGGDQRALHGRAEPGGDQAGDAADQAVEDDQGACSAAPRARPARPRISKPPSRASQSQRSRAARRRGAASEPSRRRPSTCGDTRRRRCRSPGRRRLGGGAGQGGDQGRGGRRVADPHLAQGDHPEPVAARPALAQLEPDADGGESLRRGSSPARRGSSGSPARSGVRAGRRAARALRPGGRRRGRRPEPRPLRGGRAR